MVKKTTQTEVEISQDIAEKAMQAAIFSLRRAKVLKIGAQKIKSDFNKSTTYNKRKKAALTFTVLKSNK